MAIQLFTPTFEVDECLEEIRECLEKGWTGLGFKTVQFEEAWKAYTGLPYAHYLASNTMGLELAVRIFKMKYGWADGDEIISTPLTFVSSNHAILYSDLHATFADVDEYLCLDPDSVRAHITPKTRAVMFVGMGGNVGRYDEIVKICREHGLKLILDAAHMSGTRYRGGKTPGADADVVVYSYQAVKNLPTADSGMICFADAECDAIVRKMSWLGINRDTYARTNQQGNYKWKYDVEYVGHKYHGNSVMAAIALVQLKYLDRDNSYRRTLAGWYEECLEGAVESIPMAPDCEPSRHLYQIQADKRDELLQYLNEHEIFPGVHYLDNTAYRMYSYAQGTCPNAHRMSDRILSLPMHLRLSRADVEEISHWIKEFVKK